MVETLSEVAVADADPATHAIYENMMASSGTGTPALIFRHFAVFPGFLQWAWKAVGDELDSGRALQHSLDAVARTPRVILPAMEAGDLAAAGVGIGERALLRAIFTNYNRMNPMNFSLIAAIRDLIASPDALADGAASLRAATATRPAPCPALPPPVKVEDMPGDLQQTMMALSAAIPSRKARLVPTLYRHLAIWPELMRRLAPGVLKAIDNSTIAARMNDLEREMAPLVEAVTARARARGLPPPPLEDPLAMVETLDSFLVAIPHMVVVGAALEAAMPPGVLGGTNPEG